MWDTDQRAYVGVGSGLVLAVVVSTIVLSTAIGVKVVRKRRSAANRTP